MLFILSCVLIVVLFFILNKRTKMLFFTLICLTIGGNVILKNSTITAINNWDYTMKGVFSIAYVFIALLVGANFISNIINIFSPKYSNTFRNIFIINSFVSAFFVAYLFFIKGVIYD